jgi:hypothetical protein
MSELTHVELVWLKKTHRELDPFRSYERNRTDAGPKDDDEAGVHSIHQAGC